MSRSYHISMGLGALALCAWLPAAATDTSPTAGFMDYTSDYKVQRPYDIPVDQRFSDSAGVFTTRVFPGDKPFEKGNPTEPRTEMRWETWTDQKAEHMFEADVMYEDGCARTCIHQVKSNVSGEALYLRVLDGGDLIVLNDGATIVRQGYGKWFNLKTAYNPSTGLARIWIDNQLKHSYHSSGKDWYFKNGTYTVEGQGPAVAHFKNIQLRVAQGSSTAVMARQSLAPLSGAPRAVISLGNGASILAGEPVFDLRGKAAKASAGGFYLIDVTRK